MYSPHGVSSLLSNFQIREPELEHIYNKDLEILEHAIALLQNITENKLSNLVGNIREIQLLLDDRNQFTKDFK
jgi:hypothetical protein